MRELWTCHLGTVEYREAAALQETLRERVIAGELPDLLLLLEHPAVYTLGPPLGPGRPAVRRGLLARARDRRRAHPARRQAHLPRPGQLVGYPIMHASDVPSYVRTMEQAIAAALAEEGIEARGRDHEGPAYTGVWVEDRKIASIGVHLSRGVSAHGFAINVDNDVEPFHQVTACGLPGVRMTSVALETGRMGTHGVHAQARRLRLRAGARDAPAHRHPAAPRARRRAPGTLHGVSTAAPRLHVTRSRANPGGMDVTKVLGTDTEPFRGRKPSWFKVPPPGGKKYRELARDDPLRGAPHGLPGGRLPERRRLLGARHRDVHDPRRHLHAALRLLQRQDRQADLERPARAAARRALDREDGPAPRRHHVGRPRRPARLRRRRLVRRDPLDPACRRRGARSSA